ncbi:uncharacterized protein TRAVEDRAFT_31328 [Trametes versicolor FP-101664 SS1]|uniref:uncharacterized protein n=1 Tax=Trametes versicolor (strain FP-101664) TaxID=717944 RepID=UPI0004621AD6|nr:uncharacterized protein TRAVEDRAFT_31328 [Trametes versicolor FP-101664 SS1]EIW54344.1 hypothetical protein TRAVEDRAFT_31328 [Trametes versicolor FP-101664 SS1]
MLITTPLKYAAWYYLPGYATRQLLSFFHVAYARVLRRPPPPPGTPAYAFHYRMTYLFFALVYLAYNLYDASATMEPNYYEILDLAPTADENMLKMAYRQFARRYHPDRAGAQSESMFIEVRDAYDALKSPVKRFAYERFGPEALSWSQCTTLREYVRHGLLQASGFYIVSLCSLIFFSFVSPSSTVSYWRYIMLAFTAVYELLFLLNPSPAPSSGTSFSSVVFTDPTIAAHTSFFSFLWPHRVPYQHVRFLHTLWVLGCFALSNVAPVVFPAPSPEFQENWIANEAQQISTLSAAVARETNVHLATLFHAAHGPRTGTAASDGTFPYLGELKPADAVVGLLAQEMEHLILETQMRADGGPLKSAVENAVERRKREAGRVGLGLGRRPSAQGAWVQQNGNGNGNGNGVGAAAPPVWKERVLGYVRGRSRSLG